MVKLVNRAKMSTATTGTGSPITLGSAEDGYQSFADAGVANADVVRYVIEDGSNWEIGTGTYTASGTTLTRTVSESSNADAAINLSGSAVVYVTAAAADIQQVLAEGAFVDGDKTKLDGIEAGADVTDAGNVEPLVDAHLNTSTATTGQVLSWTGSDYDWIAQSGGGGGGGSLSSASTSGASQTVDFSAADIHVSSANATTVTYTFSNPDTADQVHLVIEGSVQSELNVDAMKLVSDMGDTFTNLVGTNSSCGGIAIKSDGTKLYMNAGNTQDVYQFSMSTAGDLSTATYDSVSYDLTEGNTVGFTYGSSYSLDFKPDGTKFYCTTINADVVAEYTLSTAWDLSTASFTQSQSVSSFTTNPNRVRLKSDGTKAYILDTNADTIYQCSLSTAWDITTLTYDSVSLSLPSSEYPVCFVFNSTGDVMLVHIVTPSRSLVRYDLSTAWDVSTASFTDVSNDTVQSIVASISSNGGYMNDMALLDDAEIYGSDNRQYTFQLNLDGPATLVFPSSMEAGSISLTPTSKTALTIVTTDGGTSYQAINIEEGIE